MLSNSQWKRKVNLVFSGKQTPVQKIREIILYRLPTVLLGVIKKLAWLPDKAMRCTLDYSREFGLSKFVCDEFSEKGNCTDLKKVLRQTLDLPEATSKYPVEISPSELHHMRLNFSNEEHDSLIFNLNNDEKLFCDRNLKITMIHKMQIFDKILDFSGMSLTHTSEGEYDTSESDSISEISSGDMTSLRNIKSVESSIDSRSKKNESSIISNPTQSKTKRRSRIKLVFT